MSILKNILTISYLKNKGVRRICFLLGIILGGISFAFWHNGFKRTNYKLDYQTLEQAVADNKYHSDILRGIYELYPVEFDFGKSFYKWEEFFTDYRNIKSLCDTKTEDKQNSLSPDVCQKLKSYVYQPVKIEAVDLDKWYDIKWVIFWFYFPFLFCLPFRWIYQGFKESKNKTVDN